MRAVVRLYRQASALVDIKRATYTVEMSGYPDDQPWMFRATVELDVPLMGRYDTVRSGLWPTMRGARCELLRMLRTGCIPADAGHEEDTDARS